MKLGWGQCSFVEVNFIISPVMDEFQFTLNDLSHAASQNGKMDRTVLQFIDIATSQNVLMNLDRNFSFRSGTSYLKYPEDEGYSEKSFPRIGEGKLVAIGAHKAACVLEGPGGPGATSVGVIIDTAKTAFHKEQNVMKKVLEIFPHFLDCQADLRDVQQLRKHIGGMWASILESLPLLLYILDHGAAQSVRKVFLKIKAFNAN
ncbi:unnamed protein product [Gongylonema pulchrum]|uniref:FAD_binding_3 domain-containing protein n=1 Tax=Gongylonema pulchrum TaxID=637853 RepID=A0A183EN75_9BILA|nr:unnamed protein product [Gongylonema pulchrum]